MSNSPADEGIAAARREAREREAADRKDAAALHEAYEQGERSSVKTMPRKTISVESWVVLAFPQGHETSHAPVVAHLETRSFSVAQDAAKRWVKDGFAVVRRRVLTQTTESKNPEHFLIGWN